MINARAETLAEKPAFRAAYRRCRCLIPADGFYEWQKRQGKAKQPFYIHRRDGKPFAFAGLWERWDRGPAIESCAIITTSAPAPLDGIHDRMPVILRPADYGLWLDAAIDQPSELAPLLTPYDEDQLLADPVSDHVNRVANDDSRCIEALV